MQNENETMQQLEQRLLSDDLSCLYEDYADLETISAGATAIVQKATHKTTKQTVAAKIMNKRGMSERDIKQVQMEIKTMQELSHPYLCTLYQVIENDFYFILILEYCPGDFFDYVVKRNFGKLSEDDALRILHQVGSAVAYMHVKGYAHRDIKPENILVDGHGNIKLCDFGFTANFAQEMAGTDTRLVGTYGFVAPEANDGGDYNKAKAGVWALGILFYFMVSGLGTSSIDQRDMDLSDYIAEKGSFTLPKNISLEAGSVMKELLDFFPYKRISARNLIAKRVVRTHAEPMPPFLDKGILDDSCIKKTAKYMKMSRDEAEKSVGDWSYNNVTVTYMLLLEKTSKNKD